MRATNCRSCNAAVVWVTMLGTGKSNPLNATPDPEKGNVVVNRSGDRPVGIVLSGLSDESRDRAEAEGVDLYLSHFATCPQGNDWRKK